MSEKIPHIKHETAGSLERDPHAAEAQHEAARKRVEQAAEQAKHISHEDITKIEKSIEQKAQTSEDLKHSIESESKHQNQSHHHPQQTAVPYSAAISQARRHLKPAEQKMSRIIHNPTVESVSNAGAATVARPSGLLWGALFSLIASVAFFWISKKYGYEYNAFIGILSFVGGFFFGLLVELAASSIKRRA